MSNQNQPHNHISELKNKHSRMGMRWDVEEGQRLKDEYIRFRSNTTQTFDDFMERTVALFQRAPGGILSRLAMYFDDVPGVDYERIHDREARRKQDKEAKTADAITSIGKQGVDILAAEYALYIEAKKETYRAFCQRLGKLLGATSSLVSTVLRAEVGEPIKYAEGDLKKSSVPQGEDISHIDFSGNSESLEALRIMGETTEHLFLTGEAGTGKSTLLQYFRRASNKNLVVLAPTGVAALNVEGQTIHSFCGFGPDITLEKVKKLGSWSPKKKLLQKLKLVVIDEISMVRADLLDCVDKFLRLNGPLPGTPFGGLQMVFIGDLFQLPPVEKGFVSGEDGLLKNYETPYFYSSHAFKGVSVKFVQLRTIYRQQDRVFIDILNAVRNNAVEDRHLTVLNTRALHDTQEKFTFEQFAIYLTPTNARARQVNSFFLDKISASPEVYTGTATGTFEDRELPTDLHLQVKIGSQVMMLSNDQRKRWVNGTMGTVVEIRKGGIGESAQSTQVVRPNSINGPIGISYEFTGRHDKEAKTTSSADIVVVELETGERVDVTPYTWEMFKFVLNSKTQTVDSEATGSFTQYPFKLAWAVTIHKAQGKTFNRVYIDLATGTFAHGQLYVALSRCRTLEGLHLRRPVVQEDIILDERIVYFLRSIQSA